MLTEEEFLKESLNNNLYYLRTLRDFCINIELSFYDNNEYKKRAGELASRSHELSREIVTATNGKVPSTGIEYEIFYTKYTLPIEKLTEKLFSINLATDITESQLSLTPTDTFEVNNLTKRDVLSLCYWADKLCEHYFGGEVDQNALSLSVQKLGNFSNSLSITNSQKYTDDMSKYDAILANFNKLNFDEVIDNLAKNTYDEYIASLGEEQSACATALKSYFMV